MTAPTRQSVLDFGLPPTVAAAPAKLVERVDDTVGLLFLRGHGLGLDAPLSLRSVSDTTTGAGAPSLPGGLAEGVTYYARSTSSDAFALASSPSPAPPIGTFSAPAVGRFGYVLDYGPALDGAIRDAWAIVQSDCTAHGGDVDAPILESATRALAARLYIAVRCAGNAALAESYDGIAKLYAEVYAPKLAAYFAGVGIRNAVDATPALAENGPALLVSTPGPFRAPCYPGGASPFGGRAADRNRV